MILRIYIFFNFKPLLKKSKPTPTDSFLDKPKYLIRKISSQLFAGEWVTLPRRNFASAVFQTGEDVTVFMANMTVVMSDMTPVMADMTDVKADVTAVMADVTEMCKHVKAFSFRPRWPLLLKFW